MESKHKSLCSNPTIIINPNLADLIGRYGYYKLNGHFRIEHNRKRFFYYPELSKFSPRKNNITIDNVDDNYVLDVKSGECFPIYMLVPCGKCEHCQQSKRMSVVQRMELESIMYDSYPFFLTLTYDPKCKDFDNNLHKEHIQKWLKRVRIKLQRDGYEHTIRYAACGEYGTDPKKTKRPHYHVIIWNCKLGGKFDYWYYYHLFKDSWHSGFITMRQIDLKNSKTFFYSTKYLKKMYDKEIIGDREKPFFLSSRRGGGLGSRFLHVNKDYIQKSNDPNYSFLNPFNGSVKPLIFSQYVLNKVFPSWSRLVDVKFRQALKICNEIACRFRERPNLFYQDVMFWCKKWFDMRTQFQLCKWFFLPDLPKKVINVSNCIAVEAYEFMTSVKLVFEYLYTNSVDFANLKRQHRAREAFIGKMFKNQNIITSDMIFQRKQQVIKSLALERAREIL